jgi:DNA-binding Lrp family transcriptional regulator
MEAVATAREYTSGMDSLRELEERRRFECRLTPDRALGSPEEARAFLADRGLLTRTEDSALPSLYGACHEPPYKPGSRGFGSWPATKWPWFDALAGLPGVYALKLHRGKHILLSQETAALADPMLRAELACFTTEDDAAARILDQLREAGPSTPAELCEELGWDAADLKRARTRLESAGVVVTRSVRVDLPSGRHGHASELTRWDQAFPEPSPHGGLDEVLVAAVRAAVVAPAHEVPRWFGRPGSVPADVVERLVRIGRLTCPAPGFVTVYR